MTLPVAPLPVMLMPAAILPEITFRAAEVVPPMRLPAELLSVIPLPPLARASVPVALVPIRLPWILLPLPGGVNRPTLFALASVNQRLPSGPKVIEAGLLAGVGIGYSVIAPDGVIRPS